MPINTPEPRLPLEPEEYPLYSPPKRIGCSALAILPLLLAAAFIFLFVRITPQLAQGMVNPVRQLLNIAIPTPEPTTVVSASNGGSIATLTVAPPTATSTTRGGRRRRFVARFCGTARWWERGSPEPLSSTAIFDVPTSPLLLASSLRT